MTNKRDCLCGQRERPYLNEKGIPEGYCARCKHCGEPGHERIIPGPLPHRSSFCDTCFAKLP